MANQVTMPKLGRASLSRVPLDPREPPTTVITVRLPAATHRALVADAHDLCVSLNALCVSKLTAAINGCPIVPTTPRDGPDAAAMAEAIAALPWRQSVPHRTAESAEESSLVAHEPSSAA